jgi:type III pantothenate kinase
MQAPSEAKDRTGSPGLLAIDIGNSNIVIGVDWGMGWAARWRLASHPARSADELVVTLRGLMLMDGVDPGRVGSAVITSVVPELTEPLQAMCRRLFGLDALVVGPGLHTGMALRYQPAGSLGADRLVDALAARQAFGAPVITVDFGTATTFNVVDASGAFIGGAIAPGVGIAAQALADAGARLTRIALLPAAETALVGRSTEQGMRSGLLLGFAGLTRGLLKRLEAELAQDAGPRPVVVATGGLVYHIAPLVPRIEHVVPDLILDGMRLIAALNPQP